MKRTTIYELTIATCATIVITVLLCLAITHNPQDMPMPANIGGR